VRSVDDRRKSGFATLLDTMKNTTDHHTDPGGDGMETATPT